MGTPPVHCIFIGLNGEIWRTGDRRNADDVANTERDEQKETGLSSGRF